MIKRIFLAHKLHWAEKAYARAMFWTIVLFVVSIIASNLANAYAIKSGKTPVTDIILSNVRVFDVDAFVIYGPLVILILVLIIVSNRPATVPFVGKATALFIIIRSVFISLTHLGQFSPQLEVSADPFLRFLGGGNTGGLFFSGHTGMPLLFALIFWEDKLLRYLFIGISIVLGTAMLLGHLHYTIDVMAAFFITPSIYALAKFLFKKDWQMFEEGLLENE